MAAAANNVFPKSPSSKPPILPPIKDVKKVPTTCKVQNISTEP